MGALASTVRPTMRAPSFTVMVWTVQMDQPFKVTPSKSSIHAASAAADTCSSGKSGHENATIRVAGLCAIFAAPPR